MKFVMILMLSLCVNTAYALCQGSKFSDKSSSSTNGHEAKILSRDDTEGYYSYFVEFDQEFRQPLTRIKKEHCGWGVLEPSSILRFKDVSVEQSIYEFSWYYLPIGSAYTGKYFCYMYVVLGESPELLYNSCAQLIDTAGLPDGHTDYEVDGNKLTITNEDNEIVFERIL